jgi:chromosome segregation ATPase
MMRVLKFCSVLLGAQSVEVLLLCCCVYLVHDSKIPVAGSVISGVPIFPSVKKENSSPSNPSNHSGASLHKRSLLMLSISYDSIKATEEAINIIRRRSSASSIISSSTMITASAVQHAALDHEIRTSPVRQDLSKSHEKSAQLNTFRTELKAKVDAHLEELHTLDATKERTAQFKEEMLQKVNEHIAELEKESAKKEEVARLKDELMAKVHRHTEELEQMDAKNSDLQQYKSELLSKVEEHLKELEVAEEKGAQVRRLSVEMSSKVKEYQDHLVERAKISAQLKGEISKEVAQKFEHGNPFKDLLEKMQ